MVEQSCTPQRVYGSFEQTIFLGCSVMSFTASAGWNEQTSEVTVQLVEDPCAGDKVYWDINLAKDDHTGPDPGFLGLDRWLSATTNKGYSGIKRNESDSPVFAAYDIIGMPVYFRVADFEFAGLVQSFEQANGSSGKPTYSVKIVDPRQILDGSQIIMKDYAGGVGQVENIFNPFGAMEMFGTWAQQLKLNALPATLDNYVITQDDGTSPTVGQDGAIFGSFPQGFGGANVTNNGMQWSKILEGVNLLINSVPKQASLAVFSPYGRLRFRGQTSNPGFGLIASEGSNYSEYYVDLSDLPTMPTSWRIDAGTASLTDLIKRVCEAAGCDYYIEMIIINDFSLSSTGLAKFIKIRTSQRTNQPGLGIIPTFIDESDGLIDSTYGQELRNEVTSSFIIGGRRNPLYQVEQTYNDPDDEVPDDEENYTDDAILPYFGLDNDNNVIIPTKDSDGDWQFEAPQAALNIQFLQMTPFSETVTITELEMQAALSSKDSWATVCLTLDTDCGSKLEEVGIKELWAAKAINEIADKVIGDIKANDTVNMVVGAFPDPSASGAKEVLGDVDSLYNWVSEYAKDYYGKRYQVRVPYGFDPISIPIDSNAYHRMDADNYQILVSEEPTDAGWTEASTILGVNNFGVGNDSAIVEFFRQPNMKIGSFVRFDDAAKADKTLLDIQDYAIWDDELFASCKVEDKFVYHNKSTLFSPRAVIEVTQQVREKEDGQLEAARLLYILADKILDEAGASGVKTKLDSMIKDVSGKNLFAPLIFKFMMPDAVAIGMQSNIATYGPWWRHGPPGQVKVEQIESLVPWEFGSYDTLNTAGFDIAQESVTDMQVGEVGNLTSPGYPQYQLGWEIGASDFIGSAQSVIETRIATQDAYSNNIFDGNPFATQLASVNMGGAWTGSTGPNITNIQVGVGPNGLQTSYTMRTFTPKFGKFAKANADRLKFLGKLQLNGQRAIRGWFLERQRYEFKQKNRLGGGGGDKWENKGVQTEAKTPHSFFVGESTIFNTGEFGSGGSRRNIIETLQAKEFGNELQNYDTKAFMSFDGLIRPVSIKGDGGLPPYSTKVGGQCETSSSEGSQPPVGINGNHAALQYREIIDIDVLNPFENPGSTIYNNGWVLTDDGHDMELLGRGTGAPTGHMNMPYAGYDSADKSDYADDYRTFAMRGPMIMQGWGYDLNGRPIPNNADTESDASGGTFTDTNLECEFLDRFLRKPHTWPVGPIDLRWDRKRAVWTVPQQRLLHAETKTAICPFGSGVVEQLVGDILYDCNGAPMEPGAGSAPQYIANEKAGKCIPSGSKVITYYNPQQCEHWIIESPESTDIWPFVAQEDFCASVSTLSVQRQKFDCDTSLPVDDSNYPDPITLNGNYIEMPGCSGAEGLAMTACCSDESGCSSAENIVLQIEHIARFVEFCTTSTFSYIDGRQVASANIFGDHYWDGMNPGDYIRVSLSCTGSCEDGCGGNDVSCYPSGTCGVATIEARCIDSGGFDCSNPMYNVIDISNNLTISNTGCSGVYNTETFCPSEIRFGTGLYIGENPDNSCVLDVQLKLPFSNSGDCISQTEIDAAVTDLPDGIGGMVIGNGLRMIVEDDICNPKLVTYHTALKYDAACFETFVPSTLSPVTSTGDFRFTRLNIGRGLSAFKNDAVNNCMLYIEGATSGKCDDVCVSGCISNGTTFNSIIAGGGLNMETTDDLCEVRLGVNLDATNSDDCITSTTSGQFNSVIAGGGINADVSNCVLSLGLDLDVNGDQSKAFIFGSGFDVSTTDCVTTITTTGASSGVSALSGSYNDNCITTDAEGTFTSIVAGGGIKGNITGSVLSLGLDLQVNGDQSKELVFVDDCFTVSTTDCVTTISGSCTSGTSSLSGNYNDTCITSSTTGIFTSITAAGGIHGNVVGDVLSLGLDLDVNGDQSKSLTFGSGFDVSTTDCATTINTSGTTSDISGTYSDLCIRNSNFSGPISLLHAAGGLHAYTGTIPGEMKLGVFLGGTTTGDICSSSIVGSGWNSLAVGSGLAFQIDNSCNAAIGAALGASNTTSSICGNGSISSNWNRLAAGRGLEISTSDCEAIMGVSIGKINVPGCVTSSNNGFFDDIKIGDGLNGDISNCALTLGLNLQVNDNQSTSLTFSDEFIVSDTGGCGTTISISGYDTCCETGVTDDVLVVTGINCSGGDIYFDTLTMHFSGGLFTGTST